MEFINIKRTFYRVSDFISWQNNNSLILSPSFQRRAVWNKTAKSFLLDTIIRGLPIPIIIIRDLKSDVEKLESTREVVDGQQRLRTVMSFVNRNLIEDYKTDSDDFTIKKMHNNKLANKRFSELSREIQQRIFDYEFSVHILPSDVDDRDILEIFVRLNSTGLRLNSQELRNAEFIGDFKTVAYKLSAEQLPRWRKWGVFSEGNIARMDEVELSNELLQLMIDGTQGKSQVKLNTLYSKHEDHLPKKEILMKRFQATFDNIENHYGVVLKDTIFRNKGFFYILYSVLYHKMFGIGTELDNRKPNIISKSFLGKIIDISNKIENEKFEEQTAELFDTRRNTMEKNRIAMINFIIAY